MKEKALSRLEALETTPGRFQASDTLIAFLQTL
jgi:hypothetical protein